MLDSSVENEDHIMKLKLLRVTNYCIALSAWLLESVVPRDLG